MINKKKSCMMLMRIGPTFPGLLDESLGTEKLAVAQYQCLKTVSAIGPDHNTVSPQECTAKRSCYKVSS